MAKKTPKQVKRPPRTDPPDTSRDEIRRELKRQARALREIRQLARTVKREALKADEDLTNLADFLVCRLDPASGAGHAATTGAARAESFTIDSSSPQAASRG